MGKRTDDRYHPYALRLTAEQREAIETAARYVRCPPSAFLREVVLTAIGRQDLIGDTKRRAYLEDLAGIFAAARVDHGPRF